MRIWVNIFYRSWSRKTWPVIFSYYSIRPEYRMRHKFQLKSCSIYFKRCTISEILNRCLFSARCQSHAAVSCTQLPIVRSILAKRDDLRQLASNGLMGGEVGLFFSEEIITLLLAIQQLIFVSLKAVTLPSTFILQDITCHMTTNLAQK